MQMYKDDMKKYPKCAALIRALESTLKGNQKVLNAYLQACMEDDQNKSAAAAGQVARKALKWATAPQIELKEGLIEAPVAGEFSDACGFHNTFGKALGTGKHLIVITSIWFDAFEFCSAETDRRDNARRLTATLLHETVHWVREEADASNLLLVGGFKGHYQEAGRTFEEWAFGSPSVCTDADLHDAILSMRI